MKCIICGKEIKHIFVIIDGFYYKCTKCNIVKLTDDKFKNMLKNNNFKE